MVSRRHELTPAQARGLAAKKAKISTVAGPHLARGRSENLIRSRSCTPSEDEDEDEDEDELMDEAESPSTSTLTASSVAGDPRSPTSGRYPSAGGFSPGAFLHPSNLRSSQYSSASVSSRPENLHGKDSQDWVMESEDDGHTRKHITLAGLLNENRPLVSYPLRLNELQQTSGSVTESSTSNLVSPPVADAIADANKRSLESGYRPLAKRPPNYRPELGFQDPREPGRAGKGKMKGIKKPYRNQEERDKVKAVRVYGACLRCQIMRQACEVTDPGQPCTNCRVSRRKFNIPCTRAGPAARAKYLFPDMVTRPHDPKHHRVIIGENIPRSFRLPLTHISSFSLNMCVIEDRSIPETELVKTYFSEKGNEQNCTQHLTEEISAPLIPVITTDFDDVAAWIALQVDNAHTKLLDNLPLKVFPQAKGQHWPRSVLRLFQEYYYQVYTSRRLFKIQMTTAVRHLMSRRFYVPFGQMKEVNAQLSTEYQESDWQVEERIKTDKCMVPRFINKYLKSALVQHLQNSVAADFVELEALFKLHEKSPGSEITDLDRDEALCFIGMILLLVAVTQIKIMQVAMTQDREASRKCPLGDQTQAVHSAKEIVRTIEAEVIDHILGLWTYKYVKSNRRGELQPEQIVPAQKAQMFNLLVRFDQTKLDHKDVLSSYTDLTLNLDDSHIPRFLVDNPTRVLLKFANTLAPTKPRRWQPR